AILLACRLSAGRGRSQRRLQELAGPAPAESHLLLEVAYLVGRALVKNDPGAGAVVKRARRLNLGPGALLDVLQFPKRCLVLLEIGGGTDVDAAALQDVAAAWLPMPLEDAVGPLVRIAAALVALDRQPEAGLALLSSER